MHVKTSSNSLSRTITFEDCDLNELQSINFSEHLISFNETRYHRMKFSMLDIIKIDNKISYLLDEIKSDLLLWNISKVEFYLKLDFRYLTLTIKGAYPTLGPYSYTHISIDYDDINEINKTLLADALDNAESKQLYLCQIDSSDYCEKNKIIKLLASTFNVPFDKNLWLGKDAKIKFENYLLTTSDNRPHFQLSHEKFKFSFESNGDSITFLLSNQEKSQRSRMFTLPSEYVATFSVEQFTQFINVFFEAHYKEKIGANNICSFIEMLEMEII